MNNKTNDEIIRHFKWYFKKGYITQRDGNAAYACPGGYAVTASGIKKNDIKRNEFLIVNKLGYVVESHGKFEPSIETGAHRAILEQSGKKCSVHVHSPNTVALAAIYSKRQAFRPDSSNLEHALNYNWPELFRYTKVGHIVPFFDPGSQKLHDSIVNSLGYWTIDSESKEVKCWKDICIMQQHGVLAIGDSMEECREHIVRLEHISTILLKIVTASGSLESVL